MLYILIKGINMKSFLLGILLFISTANASDFLREFNGRTVTCEVASYNEELVPSFFRTSFVLMDILVSFDDQEQTEVFQGGKRIENLYSIKYQLRSKQGICSSFLTWTTQRPTFTKMEEKTFWTTRMTLSLTGWSFQTDLFKINTSL